MSQAPIKTERKILRLGVEHLAKAIKEPPDRPKFFHFADSTSASQFHEADIILFTDKNGKEVVIKDRFSEYNKAP